MKPAAPESRIRGLDALRLVAAMWVVFSHFGFLPLTTGVDKSHLAGLAIRGIYGNLFAGPPAVMVFFLISGFCIHYPYCRKPFGLLPFYARRYVRIAVPMFVAMVFSHGLGQELHFFQASILWSLVAELIYYTLYPVLRHIWAAVGFGWMLALAFMLALAALSIEPQAPDYDAFGNSLIWLLGLPVWLLGCRLAEAVNAGNLPVPSVSRIWVWRLSIWALASLTSVLRFHSPVGYPWTLLVFCVPVYFWLKREIAYFLTRAPWGWLEWAGQWSYSVYLTHIISRTLAYRFFHLDTTHCLDWFILVSFVLGFGYGFYLLVEKPAHWLARWLAGRVTPRPALATT